MIQVQSEMQQMFKYLSLQQILTLVSLQLNFLFDSVHASKHQ
jgi:hypothetical protein